MSETKSTKKGKIMIRIKTMNSTTYELIADRGASISSIQPEIEQKTGVPLYAQRLLYKGIYLEPTRSLLDYEINDGKVVQLVANSIPSEASSPSSYRQSEIQRFNRCSQNNIRFKKHRYLQQRINGFLLHHKQSIQTLSQNKHTIDQLVFALNRGYDRSCEPFKLSKVKFEIGQWIDIQDGSGQWSQGQIINKNGHFLYVHYSGCPNTWNQWITQNSHRIMPFKSQTVQHQHSKYLSPYPMNKCQYYGKTNPNFQSTLQTLVNGIIPTLDNVTGLLKELTLTEQLNKYEEYFDKGTQPIYEEMQKSQNNSSEKKQQQYQTPSKQPEREIPTDNISNKCEENISNKGDGDNDDISAKSFTSKRSEGLLNTSSMKSLIIDESRHKNNQFVDFGEVQSVRSVKGKNKYQSHYYYNQEDILEEEDSQYNDQEEEVDLRKKKQFQRKMKASQLAPLLDRMGRMLVDLAPHLAMEGHTEQPTSSHYNQNLSTFTNQGSLQSRLAQLQSTLVEEEQSKSSQKDREHSYCHFQIPVMLTPAQIHRLNKLLEQQHREPNS